LVSKHFRQVLGVVLTLGLVAPVAAGQQEQVDLLNVQPPQGADADLLEQFDTAVLVTLVDQVVNQVQPAPPLTVSVEWLSSDQRRASDESTFVPFRLAIDRAALGSEQAALYIRVVDKNAEPTPEGEAPIYAWDRVTKREIGDETLGFIEVPPGEYEVFIAVKRESVDVDSAVSPPFGLLRHDLTVSDFDAGPLAISSVLLFDGVERLDREPTIEQLDADPYIVGTIDLQRKFSPVYTQGDEFSFLFWVYGSDTDGSGKPDVSVELAFSRVTAAGSEIAVPLGAVDYDATTVPDGFPVASGLSVAVGDQGTGTGIPLQEVGLAPGNYRLTITATDRLADETLVEEVDFTVQ
jgi:hypothetical protein